MVPVPKELRLPANVLVDVSELQPAVPPKTLAALVGQGPLTEEILVGVENIDAVNGDIGSLVGLLNQLAIPSDPDLTRISTSLTVDLTPGITNDEDVTFFFVLDFAGFDLDGDGKVEECTNSTCSVAGATATCPSEAPASQLRPLCLRVW
jgi:hypothetical protein